MEGMSTFIGKMLYFVAQMYQQKQISQKERGILKDLIIGNSKYILNAYEQYLNEGTQLTLTTALIHILRQQKEESEEVISQDSRKPKRAISVKIPARNIQKLPGFANRV